MPKKVVQSFEVEHVQVMDEEGNIDKELMPELTEDQIKELYHLMRLAREFDEKLFKLQRGGKIGTYAEVKGEEGSEVGSAFAMAKTDWMVPSFREMAASLVRGADRVKLVWAWNGDARSAQGDENTRDLPLAIPIASQLLHAAGIAWAAKIRGEKSAVIVYFGDGATSEGDFHEAMNFAGEFKLPIIFFNQNNRWAISTPVTKQTAAQTIAQKAIAYGFKGVQLDGNDVLSSYKVTKDALERAYKGEGPTLIESLTYRMGDHTTSDDSSKYRSAEEVENWKKKDPLLRLEKYFQKIGTWTDKYQQWVKDEVKKEVDEAVEKALAIPPPPPEELFACIYDKLPPHLIAQKEALLQEVKEMSNQKGDVQ